MALTLLPVAAAAAIAPASSPSAASAAKISLNVTSGPPGASMVITGSGFPPLEIVALYVDSPNPYLDVPGPRADTQGDFKIGVTYPSINDPSSPVNRTKAGVHQICGDTGYPGSVEPIVVKACTDFTVTASPSPSPSPKSVPNPAAPSLPLTAVLIGLVIVAGLAVGAFLLVRRSGPSR